MSWQNYLKTACLCRADVVGGVPQQDFANSYKVHDLGNAKERGNNQGPAAGTFEESTRTLFSQDLSRMDKRAQS